MATLEKRIAELESRTHTESWILVQMPKEDGTYDLVPTGYQGKVHRVVFVDAPARDLEVDHANT
jgi:hypothetical protein